MKQTITIIFISATFLIGCGKKNQNNQNNNQNAASVTDIDGNVYPTVTIGGQTWMGKNLNVTKFRNGEVIPNVTGLIEWENLTSAAYCNYANLTSNSIGNGKLYNWFAIKDARNIAPDGWHVATQNDWLVLSAFLGGSQIAGKKLRETGTSHWLSPNAGTNEVGFTALGSGIRNFNYSDQFESIKEYTFWWGEPDINLASWGMGYGTAYTHDTLMAGVISKQAGLSVRCVKD